MTVRVLQIGAFPFPLGQGSQVYVGGMCHALARAGAHVTLATYGGSGAVPEGVRVFYPRSLAAPRPERSGPSLAKPLLDLQLAGLVTNLLRRERFDVIHAHNVEAPLVAALARGVARARVPLVYNLHTSLEEELPEYWSSGVRGALARPLGRVVDHTLPRLADACVALSTRAEEHLRAHGARRVEFIPPGVDVAELDGGSASRARDAWDLGVGRWVLYTGNTDAYQDLDLLMEAMHHVPSAGLLVATSSPEGEVWALARSAGLPAARVRVARTQTLAELRDALAVASIAAVPRRLCAGFPIKLLNTLGAGLVTVTAEGSAQPIPGCVRAPHDPRGFGEVLRAWVDDPMGARAAGALARAEVSARWSWEARAAELLRLYATLA